MPIIEFSALGLRLYLNTLNGNVSDDPSEIESESFVITPDAQKAFRPTAYSFCLNISDSCNLRCSYCFNESKKGRLMTAEDAISACDTFFSLFPDGEKYFIDMSGKGEPLLNREVISSVALYCKKKSDELRCEVLPMLVCNGTLLTQENVRFLQESGVLFGVSLDGPKSIHDLYRKDSAGNGTFDRIIRNVLAIEHREYVGCAATLTNSVFPLTETVAYLSAIFSTLSFRLCRSPLYGISAKSVELWKDEYTRLAERLKKNIDASDERIFLCLMNGDDLFGRYLCRMFGNSRTLNRCDGLITRFTYDMDGKIYGCPASSGISSFEVSADTIHDKQKEELYRQVSECWGCPYKFYCGGECRLETSFYGHVNRNNCELKTHLIRLAACLKIYCLRNNQDFFVRLNGFCKEKKARYRLDPELREFCEGHKDLTFSEAKVEFDRLMRRY